METTDIRYGPFFVVPNGEGFGIIAIYEPTVDREDFYASTWKAAQETADEWNELYHKDIKKLAKLWGIE